MALDVDGFSVLQAIAGTPEAFPDIRAEVAKIGRGLVVKQIKAKGLTLPALRRVRDCLGAEPFALVVDGLTEAETRSLVARLDKHHPELKTAAADWPRRHLVALATDTDAVPKPVAAKPVSAKLATAKPPPPVAPKAPKVSRALGSPAFAASWDGKDHDPKPSKKKKRRE